MENIKMARINDLTVERIKAAADIVDVVGQFVSLRKKGKEYSGLCPFHNDRHLGSFMVSKSKGIAKCFSCGWSGDSVKFLMEHAGMKYRDALVWIADRYGIWLDEADRHDYVPPKPKPAPPPLPVLALPKEWVKELRGEKVNDLPLVKWLRSLPWDDAQRNRIDENLWLYCVGAFKGRIVWWLIDETHIPRAAKLMDYLPNGHRDKERNPGWIYNQDGYRQQCNPDEHEIVKPLFGMHLLDKFPHATIHIVESEKTALIMATAYGNHKMSLWLACGGKENLNREKLKPLIEQGRKIVIYPDRDAIDEWRKIANDIHYERLSVNVEAVQRWWQPQDGEKADIADVIVRMLGNG